MGTVPLHHCPHVAAGHHLRRHYLHDRWAADLHRAEDVRPHPRYGERRCQPSVPDDHPAALAGRLPQLPPGLRRLHRVGALPDHRCVRHRQLLRGSEDLVGGGGGMTTVDATTPQTTPASAPPRAARPAPRARRRGRGWRPTVLTYGLLTAFLLGSAFPLYWQVLVGSRESTTAFDSTPPLLPGGNFFSNAQRVFDQ